MAQLVLSVAGAAVGFVVTGGNPYGAQLGFALGSAIGGSMAASSQHQDGPRLGDMRVTGTDYGSPIPYIQGSPRIACQLWWASHRREISTTTEQGKGGGPSSTTFTYEVDMLCGLTDGAISGVTRIWWNGKLVWTNLASADDQSRIDSQATDYWRRLTVYTGSASQLPDATYEAAVTDAPAYRGRSAVFLEGVQLGGSGQLPNLTFEVCSALEPAAGINLRRSITNLAIQFSNTVAAGAGYPAIVAMQPEVRVAVISISDLSVYKYSILGDYLGLSTRTGASENYPGPYTRIGFPIGMIDGVPVRYQNPTYAIGSGKLILVAGTQNDPASGDASGVDLTALLPAGEFVGTAIMCSTGQHAVIITAPSNAYSGAAVCNKWYLINRQSSLTTIVRSGTFASAVAASQFGYGNASTNAAFITCCILENNLEHIWIASCSGFGSIAMWRLDPDNVARQKAILNSGGSSGIIYYPSYPTVWAESGYCISLMSKGFVAWARSGDSIATVSLSTAVQALCTRAGLATAQFDVTGLASITKPVRALAISQVGSTRSTLEQLQAAYFFDASLSDKLYFRPRAAASVRTIPYADLAAGVDKAADQPLELTIASDLELAAQVAVQFRNMSDDQRTGTEYSDRIISGQASLNTVQLALGFTPAEAKGIADAIVADGLAGLTTATISLPLAYADLEPADVVTVIDRDGSSYRLRLNRKTDETGVQRFEASVDDAAVVTSAQITSADYTQGVSVRVAADTVLYPLDIPQLRDDDDGTGFYVAARGASSNWPGAAVVISSDNITYTAAATVAEAAVMDLCTTTLGNWTGQIVMDELNSVTVSVDAGGLSSVTRDALLADQAVNVMLIGSEVIRFCTATLVSTGPNVYTLTRLLRGQRGTEWASTGHAAGERAVLLRPQGPRRVAQQPTDINFTRYLKGVTLGKSVASTPYQTFANTAVSQRPLAPVNLRAVRQPNGDVVFSWSRRTRSINSTFCGPAGVAVPLGEAAESYSLSIYPDNSYSVPAVSFSVTKQSATYTLAAQQVGFATGAAVFSLGIYYVRVSQQGAISGYVAQQALPIATYDPGAAPPPAQSAKPRIRAFFWYDLATNTSSFAASVPDYGGATAVSALTTQAPAGRWLAAINPANSLLQGAPLSYVNGSAMAASTLSTGSRIAIVEYDPATGGYFAMVPDAAYGPYREYTIDSAGVATAGSYITVNGATSYSYSLAKFILVKFGGVWRAFVTAGSSSGIDVALQRTSSGTWVTVTPSIPLSLNPNTPYYYSQVAGAAVLTVASVPTLFVLVISYTVYNPQITYATIYSTTDGSTFTKIATTYLDASTQGATSPWACTQNQLMVVGGKLIYYHRRQNGTGSVALGGTPNFYAGLFAWQSSTDGLTWTPMPISLDGSYPVDIQIMLRPSFLATTAGVIATVATDFNTATAKTSLIASTDGIAFTTVSDAATWTTGYANAPGDYVPMAGQSYADLRLPLVASGGLALFERALIQS